MSGSEPITLSSQEPVTLLDVAREAGVSASTVSRILNGTAKVAPAKREAVEAAIARLKFKPNLFARSLKTGITMTVGVLTQSIESPFYARALKGVEDGLAHSGHAPLIASSGWHADSEMNCAQLLLSRKIDGLIILTGTMSDSQIREVADKVPVVVTGRQLEGPNLRSIQLNQQDGGYLATRHLLDLGHTRIAHITGVLERPDAMQRMQGYTRAMQEAGMAVDPVLVVAGDFTSEGGSRAMNQLLELDKPFTAVFCANDETALGARLALYQHGLHVPQEMSIVGFDDLPAAVYMTPPLTTVRQPVYNVGVYAAHTLLTMMGYPAEAVRVPPLELVVRNTTRRL